MLKIPISFWKRWLPSGCDMKLPIHNPNSVTENKIILLYMMMRIRQPMSLDQMTQFCMELELMNYFDMRALLAELVEDGYITEDDDKYYIAPNGIETLRMFKTTIALPLRKRMNEYLDQRKPDFLSQLEITAQCQDVAKDECWADLRIQEYGQELFHARLAYPNASQATQACRAFRKHGSEAYTALVQQMLSWTSKED